MDGLLCVDGLKKGPGNSPASLFGLNKQGRQGRMDINSVGEILEDGMGRVVPKDVTIVDRLASIQGRTVPRI